MKSHFLLLPVVMVAAVAVAQTAPKTATAAKANPHSAVAASHAKAATLPPGIPPVKALTKTIYSVSLRYQDIKVGTGALAEPHKVYRIAYTGWLASDGRKFDASADHPSEQVIGRDLKPEKDADGKPKMAAGQPILFPQGAGLVIPGMDQGFEGMHVGGKRRLFIPYQLAYGPSGRPSKDPTKPGIPPKSDLIFDIELVDMMDMPQPTQRMVPAAQPAPAPAAKPAAPAVAKPAVEAAKPAAEAAKPAATPAAAEQKK